MRWCDHNDVEYVFGMARNKRLLRRLQADLDLAQRKHARTGQPVRRFKDFTYRTLKSWSRRRRIVGKAEFLDKGANPRFVVTSLSKKTIDGRQLYEQLYCARGEMENRIKEQQLYLFADRTSSHTMHANQLRLWFSSIAYSLLSELRRRALRGTDLETAQCDTIRLKLLKIGAQVRISVRRISVRLASSYPYQQTFLQAYGQPQPRRTSSGLNGISDISLVLVPPMAGDHALAAASSVAVAPQPPIQTQERDTTRDSRLSPNHQCSYQRSRTLPPRLAGSMRRSG